MDTLRIAYEILYSLEHKEKARYNGEIIGPEKLKVAPDKWLEVMQSLTEKGYIAGVKINTDILGNKQIDIKEARITLDGAEYLATNSTMAKLAKVATNIIEIVT